MVMRDYLQLSIPSKGDTSSSFEKMAIIKHGSGKSGSPASVRTLKSATSETTATTAPSMCSSLASSNSSSSFGGLACIVVRKQSPKDKVGVNLEQDASTGKVTVARISKRGLFAKTDLEVGDIVLSVNRKRLGKGNGPEVFMSIAKTDMTISIAVRKNKNPKPTKKRALGSSRGLDVIHSGHVSNTVDRLPSSSNHSKSKTKRNGKKTMRRRLSNSSQCSQQNIENLNGMTISTDGEVVCPGKPRSLKRLNSKSSYQRRNSNSSQYNDHGKGLENLNGMPISADSKFNVSGGEVVCVGKTQRRRLSNPFSKQKRRNSTSSSKGLENLNGMAISADSKFNVNGGEVVCVGKTQRRRLSNQFSKQQRRNSTSSNPSNTLVQDSEVVYMGKTQRRRSSVKKSTITSSTSTHEPLHMQPLTKTLTISASKPQATIPTLGVARNKSFDPKALRSQSKSPGKVKGRKRAEGTKIGKLDRSSSHNKIFSASSVTNQPKVGLALEVVNNMLVVKDIKIESIFRYTNLRLGDVILSINDMSFRKFADAEYASIIMEKARLMVTLVVERPISDCVDTEDDDSISSFGHTESDTSYSNSYLLNNSSNYSSSGNYNSSSYNNSGDCFLETEFGEKTYRPVTITVPKSNPSQEAGIRFKSMRTRCSKSSSKRLTFVYVDKIDRDSIFANTALRQGDRVTSINNVDLQTNPNPNAAFIACSDSKEAIALVVLKEQYIDESVSLRDRSGKKSSKKDKASSKDRSKKSSKDRSKKTTTSQPSSKYKNKTMDYSNNSSWGELSIEQSPMPSTSLSNPKRTNSLDQFQNSTSISALGNSTSIGSSWGSLDYSFTEKGFLDRSSEHSNFHVDSDDDDRIQLLDTKKYNLDSNQARIVRDTIKRRMSETY